MARTLFTFLGRGLTGPQGGYRTARYDLPAAPDSTTYFAFALIADRHVRGPAFDRVVVLGTAGSMWDDLAVTFAGLSAEDPVVLDLRKAAVAQTFGAADVAALTAAIAAHARMAVDCVLIPDCRAPEEIAAVVATIADRVGPDDVVEFDVTHGYRHLPLLALSAMSLVSASRRATIAAVHYGAYEMQRDGIVPVLDLRAYLALLDWTRALSAFDASGDPTNLGHLIERETGVPVGEELEGAAHRERMLDIDAVREPWRKARVALAGTRGVGGLFREALDARFAWTSEQSLSRRQRALARQALRQGDAMRATLLLFEAAITADLEADGVSGRDLLDRDIRKRAQIRLRYRNAAFSEVSELRHLLAHPAGMNRPKSRRLVATPAQTLASLQRLDAALFAGRPR